ncbi:MAG: DUF885 domain-containing protein [Verrucomicrobiae bacterium]|nr:DUF885 domain-containing protein [Verrucomicrobiae bacterium]
MKIIPMLGWLLIPGLHLLAATAGAQSEDIKLDAFFREQLEAGFHLRPTSATRLGDRRFDGQLDDVSPAARARWEQHTRDTLAALPRRVDFPKLSPAGQVDYQIFEHSLRYSLWRTENFDPYVTDPRSYNGLLGDAVFGLLTQSTQPLETNVANSIARIRQMPKVVAAAKESLRNPPRVYVETAIQQNRGNLRFFETQLFELAGRTKQRAALKAAAEELLPALRDYQAFLENDLLPRANGEWRIGREKFYRKFELETDAGITAEQNYADALAEFDRVRSEMYVVARQAWSGYFPREVLPPDDVEGRRQTIERVMHRVAQDHGRPENLVRDARADVANLKRFITRAGILTLPEPDRCRIIEMPEFQRGNSIAYMASPPPLDPSATGHYAISPPPKSWDAAKVKSYLEEYNRHMLQILTIHEAYPGHYVQMEYANRNPSLIRKVLGSGVYIEGWAVYTEQTLLDQGYGAGNLALRLSQLKFYLRAVANRILDHRMHCENMTDEEAMNLLVNQSFQSEGEARLKVIRSKQSSVQLSTYFTGRMAHYRLRQQIQRELGDRFNLARYHEAVLAPGAVPMKHLPALVRAELGLSVPVTPQR